MSLKLSTPIQFVKRVGDRVAENLARRGVETVEDLLYHLPFRYEDRLNPKPLDQMKPGEMASLLGDVRGSTLLTTRGPAIFELTLGLVPLGAEGLGFGGRISQPTIKCLWFNGTYLRERFRLGQQVAVYGKLEASRSGGSGRFKLIQPQFEILPGPGASGPDAEFAALEMGRIVPVYESLGGTTPWGAKLTSKWTRRVMWSVFEELIESGAEIEETLPAPLRERLALPNRLEALKSIHFPEAGTPVADLMTARTPGHKRLIFEEFFYLELGLELKRRKLRERIGTRFETTDQVRAAIRQVLPFHPTTAQKRVLAEIVGDMKKDQPMRRLLQGDVGSGKTIVAMQAALVAIENGFQAALMAPTEILATQHYLSARKLLADKLSPLTGKPYRVTLLTGSLDLDRKRESRGRIMRGEAHLAIGTHALIEEKVDFANLGLVIVDEQHRFGVQQRFKLMKKPNAEGVMADPDVLVMTATPIPRTLALTIYGDMDVSVIDELPPGRTPIVTRRTSEASSAKVWEFVRKQVALGHQAYIVYPIIEGANDDQPELDFAPEPSAQDEPTPTKGKRGKKTESLFPKAKLRSATQSFDELRAGPLQGLRVGLLHGRMSADDKEVAMRRFQRGETDVLIATTVIEVGVDVPNASVMVIDHAERFGLAQMHQLRGRVGRGAAKSYCILMTGDKVSESAELRLDAMVHTQNGFELAELDLAQRGPGEFFGTRQAGMPEFRVADLGRDREVLEIAKSEAARFAQSPDPTLTPEQITEVWDRLKQQWQRRYALVEA
ncbi:ATP-dependent DNA helicase RecG [Granulicella tundricola]|uniref:ATP-dependent DNA helicase RecG n=1 Tax=Granulicella tundricola (strain ATCC BAA-1859 / DSM 23138 / MP5ACTX9) TaxID=1198114 RepID=E8X0D0_GRATM|nr:ATP-dependent DNA helicase RecG [Granulicella tundricola MP5ACTX9]